MRRIIWITIATVLGIGFGKMLWVALDDFVVPRFPKSGLQSPSFGGPFSLVDHRGVPVTEKTYAGKVMLVFFGFTSCPDVCPTGLSLMSDLLDTLGDQARHVQPILITVDPERDTKERLADYVQAFHPSLVALTGTIEQIEAVAKAYRVYFKKAPLADSNDYSVDHSAQIFVMGRKGEFLRFLDPSHESKDTALAKLRLSLNESGW